MRLFLTLLQKDARNAKQSLWPAILLGIPLILLLAISNEVEKDQWMSWRTAFWFSFFFSSTALFYRSFGQETYSRNFGIYTAFRVSAKSILASQTLIQFASLLILGIFLGLLTQIFWSAPDFLFVELVKLIVLSSLTLAPTGSLLGLLLQNEREVLFPLFYLPFASPVIIGTHSLSSQANSSWMYIIGIFCIVGGFLSFLIFEFFFDELTEL